jgi:hypothetical protein
MIYRRVTRITASVSLLPTPMLLKGRAGTFLGAVLSVRAPGTLCIADVSNPLDYAAPVLLKRVTHE